MSCSGCFAEDQRAICPTPALKDCNEGEVWSCAFHEFPLAAEKAERLERIMNEPDYDRVWKLGANSKYHADVRRYKR